MTKRKSTKRTLLLSALSLLLCVSMLVSSTFAWFTDSVTSGNNKIVSGTLKLDLELLDKTSGTWNSIKNSQDPIFNYDKWEPGYTDVKILKVENEGNLALKWIAKFVSEEKLSILADVIDVYVKPSQAEIAYPANRNDLTGYTRVGTVAEFVDTIEETTYGSLKAGEKAYLGIALKMQESADNKYQDLKLGVFDIQILATQLTYESDSFDDQYDKDADYIPVDTWDGTADTSWYNDTDTQFTLATAEAFAGLADLVDAGNTFEGKTVKLAADIDLANKLFDPIGSYRDNNEFKGVFDGQGHAIKNMSQNTWELNNGYYYGDLGMGLFGKVRDAEIKNLVMDGVSISGESGMCGAIAAAAYGECTFKNITVKNSQVNDYQYYAAGVVGWASGTHTYKNINIEASTVIGSQWGDFGNANGGIIGGAGTSGTYHFEDCTVACRIDATNDVVSAYQWYNYRSSGMLIGKVGPKEIKNECTTVTADNVTCKNVTVIYGDWANYTYCEFAGTGYPYVRVQAGVSVDAYSNVRYGHPTDANGNTVVDDNHVHNDGEAHHELIVFDQLFGGPANARYCYYGISAHPGVTVIYNNK